MNAHLLHALGIILLVVLSIALFAVARRPWGTPPKRYIALALALVALFWASWRWLFFDHTKVGPFRHLSGYTFLLVLGLTLAVIFLNSALGPILRVVAMVALVFALAAPFQWVGEVFADHSAKAECLRHAPDKLVCTQVQAHPVATPSPSASPADCHGYTLKYDANDGGRFASAGLKGTTPAESLASNQMLRKEDPRKLMIDYNAVFAGTTKVLFSDFHQLVDTTGQCLNQAGQDAYQQLLGADTTGKVTNEPAPATGVNTGARKGGAPFQEPVGKISGNRAAVTVTYRNGNKVSYMMRCANPVTAKPIPHIPPPPPPTPTPTCKPGVPVGSPSCLPCYSPGNGPTPVGSPQPGQTICAGKDPTTDVNVNPSVPPGVQGPNPDCPATPCQGGTATGPNHSVAPSPPAATDPTQCNGPCQSPSPRPTTSSSPAPSGYPSPPPAGGPGAESPSPNGPPPTTDPTPPPH